MSHSMRKVSIQSVPLLNIHWNQVTTWIHEKLGALHFADSLAIRIFHIKLPIQKQFELSLSLRRYLNFMSDVWNACSFGFIKSSVNHCNSFRSWKKVRLFIVLLELLDGDCYFKILRLTRKFFCAHNFNKPLWNMTSNSDSKWKINPSNEAVTVNSVKVVYTMRCHIIILEIWMPFKSKNCCWLNYY